jgi:hypothetical protein
MYDARTSLPRFLAFHRFRLNLILVTAKFITWFTGTGMVCGMIVLMVHWLSRIPVGVINWLMLSLCGGLIGMAVGRRQRLDNYAAAGWLDEHLKTGELLSAALVCLNRDCSGCFDHLILESATTFIDKAYRIRWPVKHLLKRTAMAVIVVCCVTLGLNYWLPFSHNSKGSFLSSTGVKEAVEKLSSQDDRQLVVESPRTLSKMLFPEDERMAILAERAFREGNLAVLQSLLRDAEFNIERLMAKAANPDEQRRLKNEIEQRKQLMDTLIAQSQQEKQNLPQPKNGEGESLPEEEGFERGKEETRKDGSLAQWLNSGQGDRNQMKEGAQDHSNYLPAGGNKAGTGHNPKQGKWGKVAARTGREETIISKNKDSQTLEYVLPGKDARIPLSQVVPDAERSAEAAIHRQGIPFEYEDFIRNYFLLLAKESKEATKKEAHE